MPFNMNALNILINENLHLGSPAGLNDPFEGEFIFNHSDEIPNEEYSINTSEKIIIDKKKLSNEEFITELKKAYRKNLQQQYGVSCFSERNDSILMWAHYADLHKGICLIFEKEKLINSVQKNYHEIKLDKVKYNRDFIPIDIKVTPRGLDFLRIEETYLNKLNHWKYEKEVRLHWYVPENFTHRNIGFDCNSIVGIILGHKIDSQSEILLTNIIASPKLKHLKWYKALPDLKLKKMKIEKFGGFFIPRSLSFQRN